MDPAARADLVGAVTEPGELLHGPVRFAAEPPHQRVHRRGRLCSPSHREAATGVPGQPAEAGAQTGPGGPPGALQHAEAPDQPVDLRAGPVERVARGVGHPAGGGADAPGGLGRAVEGTAGAPGRSGDPAQCRSPTSGRAPQGVAHARGRGRGPAHRAGGARGRALQRAAEAIGLSGRAREAGAVVSPQVQADADTVVGHRSALPIHVAHGREPGVQLGQGEVHEAVEPPAGVGVQDEDVSPDSAASVGGGKKPLSSPFASIARKSSASK